MFRFITFIALLSCALGATLPNYLEGRIVNGENTTIEAHPYQVSLQTNGGFHFCGGSIVNEDTIVTAAHCMQRYTAAQFKVRLGSTFSNYGGELVAVKKVVNHPGFVLETFDNDIAVIKMASPVRESSKVRYISLAKRTPPTGTKAVVSGWGTTCFLFCSSPQHLQRVEVDVIEQKECSSDEYKYGDKILYNMLCAKSDKKDACQGDSGGPLVSGGKLIGVVSWGKYCAHKSYPGVYADVPTLHQWVVDTIATM